MKQIIVIFVMTAINSGVAIAQIVIQADQATLQPLIARDKEGFLSCGVRAVVVTSSTDFLDAYDFSLTIHANMTAGTLKAGKSRIPVKAALARNFPTEADVPPPINFWVAKETEGKAINPTKIIPADTKGFILALANVVDTYTGLAAMINGDRMQFAIRYKYEPADIVVSFSVQMPEVERTPLLKCLAAVTARLVKTVEDKK